jgi:hypothetical protein
MNPAAAALSLPTVFLAAGGACLTLAALAALWDLGGGAAGGPARAGLQRWSLQATRAAFLLLGAGLAVAAVGAWRGQGLVWPRDPWADWGLLTWLVCFVILHVHRVPAFKGRGAMAACVAGWGLACLAFFLLR